MYDLDFTQQIRCYNGAFDSTSQRVIDAQEKAMLKIRTVEPEAHVTYTHGIDGGYTIHVWGRELSAYHSTYGGALREVLDKLFPLSKE